MPDVDVPDEYWIHVVPLRLEGGVAADVEVTGDPDNPIAIDAGLDDVNVSLRGDPDQPVTVDLGLDDVNVNLGLDNVRMHLDPLEVDLGLDNVRMHLDPLEVDLGLDDINVCLSLALTEIPRVRVHLPTKYDFGFCLFGIRIFSFTFAGETMLVTQDNPPRIFHQMVPHEPPERPQGLTDVAYRVTLEEEETVEVT
jgi:hypothetical protein